ncbi:MAG: von Willebrand factor type A domain-containing protein, partial [Acidobacteriota bacterium]
MGLGLGFAPLAQTSLGTVTGSVKDGTGVALQGATVRLAAQGSTPTTVLTDTAGTFTFRRVPIADYDVTATLPGFAAYTTHVAVRAGFITRLAIVLRINGVAEEVQVETDPYNSAAKVARNAPPKDAGRDPRQNAVSVPRVAGGAIGGMVAGGPPAPPFAPGVSQMTYPGFAGRSPRPEFNTDSYDRIEDNAFHAVSQDPLSTFSIDVDTASYANVRRFLTAGTLPPPDAVRIEELINYFRFDYARPAKDLPFSVTTELTPCPWNPQHRLALVGLQSRPLDQDAVPARNLVFLLDVSGSMSSSDRLPLIRTAMRMLVDTLTAQDRIA